jgi:hypothetical protein
LEVSCEPQATSYKLQAASAFLRSVFFVSDFSSVQSFLLFALMQKVEQKDQGKANASGRFSGPAHNGHPKLV